MKSLDDLLIERRRGTLSATEAAELERALGEQPELELSLSAGEAFDRLDTDLPGDAALLEHIVNGAARTPLTSPWLKLRWLLVLPLLGVIGGGAWVVTRAPVHAAMAGVASATASARALPSEQPPDTPENGEARFEFEARSAPGTTTASAVPGAAPSSAPASAQTGFEFEPQRGREKRAPAPAASSGDTPAPRARGRVARPSASPAPPRTNIAPPRADIAPARTDIAPAALSSAERAETPTPPAAGNSRALENLRALSARELFERGNQARAHDWLEAETLYTLLLDSYPASREAAVAELTLGKRALAVGRAEDALRWFRHHQQRAGNTLQAEAAWGECQALEQLQRRSELVAAWEQLIERYPETSYAAVARRRLEALE